eukprot:gene5841-6127_t
MGPLGALRHTSSAASPPVATLHRAQARFRNALSPKGLPEGPSQCLSPSLVTAACPSGSQAVHHRVDTTTCRSLKVGGTDGTSQAAGDPVLRWLNELPQAPKHGVVVQESESRERGRVLFADRDIAMGEVVLDEGPAIFIPKGTLQAMEAGEHIPDSGDPLEHPPSNGGWRTHPRLRGPPRATSKPWRPENTSQTPGTPSSNLQAMEAGEHIPDSGDPLECFQTIDVAELPQYPTIQEAVSKFDKATKGTVDINYLAKFVSAYSLNAHTMDDNGDSGLYYLASKCSHSCSPNAFNAARPGARDMKLVAMKDIKKGEEIYYAYISNMGLTQPARLRQSTLFKDRGFKCMCSRCVSEDHVRMLPCSTKGCQGSVLYNTPSKAWGCTSCKTQYSASQLPLKEEQRLENRVGKAVGDAVRLEGRQAPTAIVKLYRSTEHWTVFNVEHMLLEAHVQGFKISGVQQVAQHFTKGNRWQGPKDLKCVGDPLAVPSDATGDR